MSSLAPPGREQASLCEVLDRVLNKGAVIKGEVTLSVANIDLLYLGLEILLSSVETARKAAGEGERWHLSAGASGRAKIRPAAEGEDFS